MNVVLQGQLLSDQELGFIYCTFRRELLRIDRYDPWMDLYSSCPLAVLIKFLTRASVFSAQYVSILVSSMLSSFLQNRLSIGIRKNFLPSTQKQLQPQYIVQAQVPVVPKTQKSSVDAMKRRAIRPPMKIKACLRAMLKCQQWGLTCQGPRSSESVRRALATPRKTGLVGSWMGWTQARWVDRRTAYPFSAVEATCFWKAARLAAYFWVKIWKVFCVISLAVANPPRDTVMPSISLYLIDNSSTKLRSTSQSSSLPGSLVKGLRGNRLCVLDSTIFSCYFQLLIQGLTKLQNLELWLLYLSRQHFDVQCCYIQLFQTLVAKYCRNQAHLINYLMFMSSFVFIVSYLFILVSYLGFFLLDFEIELATSMTA